MSLELLAALFAFAVPGALAVVGWDWGVHRTDRPLTHQLGYGIIVSIFAYTILQVFPALRLTNLLDAKGALSLARMLWWKNLVVFASMCTVLGGAGYLSARKLPQQIAKITGKSPYPNVWCEIMTAIARGDHHEDRAWLIVRTKAGWEWYGRPHLIPAEPRAGDHIVLREVQGKHLDSEDWEPQEPVVIVALADIDFVQAAYHGAPDYEQWKERRRAAPAPVEAQGAAGGQPAGGVLLLQAVPPAPPAEAPEGTPKEVAVKLNPRSLGQPDHEHERQRQQHQAHRGQEEPARLDGTDSA